MEIELDSYITASAMIDNQRVLAIFLILTWWIILMRSCTAPCGSRPLGQVVVHIPMFWHSSAFISSSKASSLSVVY